MIHVFVGPTLPAARVAAICGGAQVHPPVVHGDLLRLDVRTGDVVVIVDGGYHHTASVRHKEILLLLASGIVVVGCSSMGALRAAELTPYGMVGNGVVFEMYRHGVIDADDEVAVAHGDGPEYRRCSEPLVNVRHALAAARRTGVISMDEETAVTDYARSVSYTSRTWRAIALGLERDGSGLHQTVHRVRAFLDDNPDHADVKATDAIDTLTRIRDIVARRERTTAWMRSPDWKHRFLFEWATNFAGCRVGDVWVELGSIIRYRQIYDSEFPSRWRRFVLRQILRSGGVDGRDLTEKELVAQAVRIAGAKGLEGGSLTPEQLREWVLEAERDLPPRDILCLVLVRSYRPPRGIHDLLAGEPDLVQDDAAQRAVAESYVVNTSIAGWAPRQSVHHTKVSALRGHLADTWGLVDDDTAGLEAGARDRGFVSLADAVAAVRPFFLRHYVRAATPTAGSNGVGS